LRSDVIQDIARYIKTGITEYLWDAIRISEQESIMTIILDTAIQYEEGAKKYGERNWEKGIPLHSYIDSAVRHYLKFLRGDKDENHLRAFRWNLLCAIHTHKYLPDMIDLPFTKEAEA